MKPNLRAQYRAATNVLCALFVIISLLPVIGCGDSNEDGAEDTGSVLHISAIANDDPDGRNVDIGADDADNNCQFDHSPHDVYVSVTFVNVSVVPPPDPNTVTPLRVESYTVDYSSDNPTAPPLASRTFPTTFVVEPDDSVTRSDILLAANATQDEFRIAIGFSEGLVADPADPEKCFYVWDAALLPTDFPTEYTAHYTFHVVNVPFGESQTVTADVNFSIGQFTVE